MFEQCIAVVTCKNGSLYHIDIDGDEFILTHMSVPNPAIRVGDRVVVFRNRDGFPVSFVPEVAANDPAE